MAGFLYLVVLPAELVMLWLALGAWRTLWARVVSSSSVLVVAGTTMLLLDPWQMGLVFSSLPALVAAYALPFHVKDLLSQRQDRAAQRASVGGWLHL
jgi:hypothetical protein